jgi:HCOMODA/2-hydroxy-3-carboxy-muconic semialdehyde decarboxylase
MLPRNFNSYGGRIMWDHRAFGALAVFAFLSITVASTLNFAVAQSSPPSAGPVDLAVIDDLVLANRILADQNILDGFGHVSVRHPTSFGRYLMSRSIAPALVSPADIMEYDLDSNPVDPRGRQSFLERFIHGEIYKKRPDVSAVVHTHSAAVIPFSVSQSLLRPISHTAAFLSAGVPVFEIRKVGGMTNMLVGNAQLGKHLAETLGDKNVVLMRGHGDVVVAGSVQMAVFRAYYTDANARLQSQAIALGTPVTYIEAEEGQKAEAVLQQVHLRVWDLWKRAVQEKMVGK